MSRSFSSSITHVGITVDELPLGFRILHRPTNDLDLSCVDRTVSTLAVCLSEMPGRAVGWLLFRSWNAFHAASLLEDIPPPCHALLAVTLALMGLPAAHHSLNHEAFADSFHPTIP